MKLSLIVLVSTASAWRDNGHALVGRIAEKKLLKDGRGDVVDILTKLLRTNTEFPAYNTLTRATTWPDKIKSSKLGAPNFYMLDDFHLTDFPATIGVPSTTAELKAYADNTTLIGAHTAIRALLTTTIVRNDTGAVVPMPAERGTLWTHDTSLRYLLHLVGDIHQPLHSTALFDEAFCGKVKKCFHDLAGWTWNLDWSNTEFQGQSGLPNDLHYLFDYRCLTSNLDLIEIDDLKDDELESQAVDLMSRYPEEYFTRLQYSLKFDMMTVFEESHRAAIVGLPEDANIMVDDEETEPARLYVDKLIDRSTADFDKDEWPTFKLTKNYLKWCRTLSQRRVTLAGYRLSSVLIDIAGSLNQKMIKLIENNQPPLPEDGNAAKAQISAVILAAASYLLI